MIRDRRFNQRIRERENQERQAESCRWEAERDAWARERERAEKIGVMNEALKLTKPDSAEEDRILALLDKLDLCRDEWTRIDGGYFRIGGADRPKVQTRMARAAFAEAELQVAHA